jgi:hypothetical protein
VTYQQVRRQIQKISRKAAKVRTNSPSGSGGQPNSPKDNKPNWAPLAADFDNVSDFLLRQRESLLKKIAKECVTE